MVFGCVSKTLVNCIFVTCISASLTYAWLHYKASRKQSNKTKVLFYRPEYEMNCRCNHIFDANCTSNECSSIKTKEIIICLMNARKTLDICVFAISNLTIVNAIISAKKRGVRVRIIICNCILMASKEIKRFKHIGIVVKYQKDKESYMHNKYAVVDSTWLINGSLNWTLHATIKNWESFIITDITSLVDVYSKDFEVLWTTI